MIFRPLVKYRITASRLAAALMLTGLGWSLFAWPILAAGATLKVSPSSGSYEVGALVDVAFLLDTGGESVNAVQADIVFPADKLQVVNPVASTSFISIWVTAPTYSNTDGTIHFQGGIPNPGIKTSAGVVSTVTFRIKAAGKAVIKYATSSKVLRNDGEGTNILTATGTAEFTLKLPPPAGPVVTSPTHPDANAWYGNRDIQFQWEATDGALGYSYSFDQNSKQDPDETVDTTGTVTSVKATGDGLWYFHIRAQATTWGGTTVFPVQIDSTPPADFKPELDKKVLTTEEKGTLRWLTTDAASGIDHYEVKQVSLSAAESGISTLFVEAISPYIIAPLEAGQYEFIVRAIDRAGNTADGSAELRVVAGGLTFLARVPLLSNPAVANGALIGLGVLAFLSVGLLIIRRFRLRANFARDLDLLQRDAQKKANALQQELEQLQQAQQTMQNTIQTPTAPTPPVPTWPPTAST